MIQVVLATSVLSVLNSKYIQKGAFARYLRWICSFRDWGLLLCDLLFKTANGGARESIIVCVGFPYILRYFLEVTLISALTLRFCFLFYLLAVKLRFHFTDGEEGADTVLRAMLILNLLLWTVYFHERWLQGLGFRCDAVHGLILHHSMPHRSQLIFNCLSKLKMII